MAPGAGYEMGYKSIVGVGEETTYGTFATSTSFIEFSSEGFKRSIEEITLNTFNATRNPRMRLQGKEMVEGAIECFLNAADDGIVRILKNAMGGTVSSAATSTAEYIHTLNEGDLENNARGASASAFNCKGLSFLVRKGSTDKYQFRGCRVNNLTIKGEIGQPIQMSVQFVGKDSTITTADTITAVFSDIQPLMFHGVSITVTGAAEQITGFELTINNNLVSDNNAGALGSRSIVILPAAQREVKLKLSQRYDTTTAHDRALAGVPVAINLLMTSSQTIGSGAGNTTYSMRINLPEAYYNTADPVIGDKGVIMQELDISTVQDSTSAYSIQMVVCNATENY